MQSVRGCTQTIQNQQFQVHKIMVYMFLDQLWPNAGFLKLWYAYHQWHASNSSMVHGISKNKSKDKRINKLKWNKDTNTLYAHAQTISSCRKNTALFDEMCDNYFLIQQYKEIMKVYCVTVYKIIIGGTVNVLYHIWWYASWQVWEHLP
jgi:hypothetical protein